MHAMLRVTCIKALCHILKNAGREMTTDFLREHSTTARSYEERQAFRLAAKQRLTSYSSAISSEALSSSMAQKAATSSLASHHIRLSYARGKIDGVRSYRPNSGNARVTQSERERVITSVCQYLQNLKASSN